MKPKVKNIDIFVAVNSLLFIGLCAFRYYKRFIDYVGADRLDEFFIYAGVVLMAIILLWQVFRRHAFDPMLLALVQIGILMHFCGAFILIDGGRLYDAHLLGVRYDKYVHLVNAFSATLLMHRLFQIQRIRITPVNSLFMVLAVLGLGALVEIVEYAVVLTVPHNGVGGYDNNMQDLLANMTGALVFVMGRVGLLQWRQKLANAREPLSKEMQLGMLIENADA